MAETKKFLGSRIQEVRKSLGLKQSHVAEMVGIDSKHMSKIECGRCYPSFDLLDKIASVLKVAPCEFLRVEHLRDKETLIIEINNLLINSDAEQLKIGYKILKELLHQKS